MKQFRLTIKRTDSSEEFQELSQKIMKHLYKDFDLQDDAGFCNMTLADLLGCDLEDLSLLVNGNDWPGSVKALEGLKLVGDQYGISDNFCPKCGHPEYYYTGGQMLCNQCEYSELATDALYGFGDIADYSGRVVL